eukprot:TRINITY_DN23967_c0_g1_i1.p1 TRINITY_DN23967_c0_g1~~TRINITY_DN23967_c0_g1_i1.p1  ORF type:complete len:320 (+),score=58.29 TRINITY_DN23967_c0_g1_i1:54-962(+)
MSGSGGVFRQKFLNPDDVTLHCTDFKFEDREKEVLEMGCALTESDPDEGCENRKGGHGTAWENHYKTHKEKFYPIKNYIIKAFPDLLGEPNDESTPQRIMECGCGTGSAVLPLMKIRPHDEYFAFDISPTAVEGFKDHEVYKTVKSVTSFVWDCSKGSVPEELEGKAATFDFILLFFVLSAIPGDSMQATITFLSTYLKPNGAILFRDYGKYDHSQLRFHDKHVTPEHERCIYKSPSTASPIYFRGDGTQTYYFSVEEVDALARTAGLTASPSEYHCNQVTNRKNGKVMRKVFVNSVLRKAA